MPAEISAPQLEHFARRRHVIAVDPRSQGRSDKPSEGHYPDRRSRDYKEIVDKLRLAPVVLVGWSLAVREVLAYVDQFGTATLRGIVLVDGSPGGEYGPELAARRLATLKEMQRDRRNATEKTIRSNYKRPQPEAYYQRMIEAALKTPTNTAVTLAANVAWDLRPVLARVDCPVRSWICRPGALSGWQLVPAAYVTAPWISGKAWSPGGRTIVLCASRLLSRSRGICSRASIRLSPIALPSLNEPRVRTSPGWKSQPGRKGRRDHQSQCRPAERRSPRRARVSRSAVSRLDLYLVRKPGSHDPKRQRVSVVVSRQALIDSRFSSVICAPVYSRYDGLSTQVRKKSMLTHYIGRLSGSKADDLNRALLTALELEETSLP